MRHKSGAEVPETAVYWCTVCKKPARFEKGSKFPECKNLCGRGYWELVKAGEKPEGAS